MCFEKEPGHTWQHIKEPGLPEPEHNPVRQTSSHNARYRTFPSSALVGFAADLFVFAASPRRSILLCRYGSPTGPGRRLSQNGADITKGIDVERNTGRSAKVDLIGTGVRPQIGPDRNPTLVSLLIASYLGSTFNDRRRHLSCQALVVTPKVYSRVSTVQGHRCHRQSLNLTQAYVQSLNQAYAKLIIYS